MAKNKKRGADFISEMEENKRRALLRIGLCVGAIVIVVLVYVLLVNFNILTSENITIMQGASLIVAVVACSIMGANFNTYTKANKQISEYNLRNTLKKKKR